MTLTDCSVGQTCLTADVVKENITNEKNERNGDTDAMSGFRQLGAMAALCNAAELDASQADIPIAQRNIFGDATDTAVLRFSESLADGNIGYFRGCWQRVFDLAFNSKNKFMIRTFLVTRREALRHTVSKDEANSFTEQD